MRNNYTQKGKIGNDNRTYIDRDWFNGGLPSNISLGENVYIDSSYGFAAFDSLKDQAMSVGEASGCYDRASFIVSEEGVIEIGKFTILNGSTIVCKNKITIGDHCMLAWGSVITDSWTDPATDSLNKRTFLLETAAESPRREYPFSSFCAPVVLEDNVWVGFDAVILPGVRLGRGCIVGCKTVVKNDVPPYAVIVGNPQKVIKYLTPNDTEEMKQYYLMHNLKISMHS